MFLANSWSSSAEAGAAGASKALRITGSSTMCPMIAEIGKRFTARYPELAVTVECGGSERGIRDLRKGTAEIGMVSRNLDRSERDMLGFPMARDGVSLIVHKSNPVRSLSNRQVAGIFTNAIRRWKEVGGSPLPIVVLLREKQKSSTELFNRYYGLSPEQEIGAVIAGDNPATINAVASERRAIGYVSSGHAERDAKAGVPIKLLPVNNIMPTSRNIITGNYPISRPLMLVTKEQPKGATKLFIDYALSSSVTDLIEKFDYVPYQD